MATTPGIDRASTSSSSSLAMNGSDTNASTNPNNPPAERFTCPHPSCNKTFSRQEHLARHKLNHWPKEIFECSYVFPATNIKCKKTFVRKDLLMRHHKRHQNDKNRLYSRSKRKNTIASSNFHNNSTTTTTTTNTTTNNNNNSDLAHAVISNANSTSNSNSESSTMGNSPVMNAASTANASPMYTNTNVTSSANYNNNSINKINNTNSTHNNSNSYNQFFDWVFDNDQKTINNHYISSNNENRIDQQYVMNNASNVPQQHVMNNTFQAQQQQPMPHAQRQPVYQPVLATFKQQFPNQQIYLPSVQQQVPISKSPHLMPSSMHQQPLNNSTLAQQQQQQQHQQQSSLQQQSDALPTKFQDLFSIDYLYPDPLQNLMQELSSSQTNSHHSNNGVYPIDITTPPFQQEPSHEIISNASSGSPMINQLNPKISPSAINRNEIFPQSQTRFIDSKRGTIKDNLHTQKSNINELKRQTSNPNINREKFKTKKRGDGNDHEKGFANKQKLKELMRSIPTIFFPDPRTKYQISKEKCQELCELIPELRYIPNEALQTSLKAYWKFLHPQFRILHKPSFHINLQPPILILSLIMSGAGCLGSTYRETISDPICGPLRWVIFSHPDFQPPSRTYIIQSLLLLEAYEKTSTNRYLHERSYLHHGTTIQLLRRTSSLGGHPLRDNGKQDTDNKDSNELNDVLLRWIEFESLKRVAFFAFYMDVTHAVVYGYMNLFISFRQIQLELPCPDRIWESYQLSFEILKEFGFGCRDGESESSQTFLSSLKKLIIHVLHVMRNCNTELENNSSIYSIQSILGKKLMLAGLLSVMFQCQEENYDPFISSILTKGNNEQDNTWKEIISFALNYWLFEIQGGCQNSSLKRDDVADEEHGNLTSKDTGNDDDEDLKMIDWNFNEFDCKLPVYHMAQVILRIFHNDYYIAAGMPWRMNVKIGEEEFQLVHRKMVQFSRDIHTGCVTIVYAFQLLFEMFVRRDPKTNELTINTTYEVNTDCIITRPNCIALVTILIWTYTFTLYGPEVNVWNNGEALECDMDDQTLALEQAKIEEQNKKLVEAYDPVQDFGQYITKMYNHLYIDKAQDVVAYQNTIWQKALELQRIRDQNHIYGFITHIKNILDTSYWDLGRELGKLLNNCPERSLGKKSHVCHDMYDV